MTVVKFHDRSTEMVIWGEFRVFTEVKNIHYQVSPCGLIEGINAWIIQNLNISYQKAQTILLFYDIRYCYKIILLNI